MNVNKAIDILKTNNPSKKFAVRIEKCADGGECIGYFYAPVNGFIPCMIEVPGGFDPMPCGYLEIDGKPVGTDPSLWIEQ